ncbi:GntR family transcriptional regulator [Clostridium tetanomorphum]|uniref:GntR family transcriptional regulator n=1 Tax=Clostridium tetanomorphum TaxID=1553 RepID=UPI00044725D4|nr:GntR family transcriptional regulator [Clostridium tetanomorphum]KAJ49515.1 GntR family transcriptional regulator [Clostridium tetanomorphum DSM 665]KAJ53023.1 GntR family transcriptional regulator [Clostridium tetanomorphum DSM 665]MBP1864966.1 GntR family transcriptional regulator [Clostridium tetanomorphum]NRS83172.1 GntR family transcriptional regulator [Clostridium tetanomorphum]SQC01220.1 GntR family transcriptional regulator [Clostridium tetanomorphum]
MRKISKNNPLPLHYQIKEILQEMIENEELKPGEVIPTERELCEIQGVSRMTVNKAIMSLVNEGLLYREQGKGTFVCKPKRKQQISELKGFTEEMKEKGLKTDTEILSFQVKEGTKQIRSILCMPNNENKIIEINRLRKSEGEPVAIEIVWIPYNLFSDVTKETIAGKSLYSIFREKYGYYPMKARQTIEPIMLNEYEAELLDQNEGALALMFRRTTYMENEVPIEYTKAIYRSDIYKYEITLK